MKQITYHTSCCFQTSRCLFADPWHPSDAAQTSHTHTRPPNSHTLTEFDDLIHQVDQIMVLHIPFCGRKESFTGCQRTADSLPQLRQVTPAVESKRCVVNEHPIRQKDARHNRSKKYFQRLYCSLKMKCVWLITDWVVWRTGVKVRDGELAKCEAVWLADQGYWT